MIEKYKFDAVLMVGLMQLGKIHLNLRSKLLIDLDHYLKM